MRSRPLLFQLFLGLALGLAVLFVMSRTIMPPFPLSASSDPDSPPVAAVEPLCKDFGAVAKGSVLSAHFRIQNKGNRRLLLRRVDATCDCTSNDVGLVVVDPGSCRTVSLEFTCADRAGRQRHEATYRTNDPRQPFLSLVGMAQVE